MLFAAILLGICQIVSMLGACLLFRMMVNAKQAEIEARAEKALRDWVESPKEGEPSKLAITLDAMGAVVGSAAARSLMASLKQQSSSVAKVANGISDEVGGATNPIMGLLMGGKRGKGAAVMRLAELIGPMLGGGAKDNGNGTASGGSEYTGRRHHE
jgi:hypothetical protein